MNSREKLLFKSYRKTLLEALEKESELEEREFEVSIGNKKVTLVSQEEKTEVQVQIQKSIDILLDLLRRDKERKYAELV